MKQFDIKSVLVGALLAVIITLSIAAVTGSHAAWEYKVIIGKAQDDLGNQDKLGQAINNSVGEGWELVSASGPNDGNYGLAVMRRERK